MPGPGPPTRPSVRLLGVRLDAITERECVGAVSDAWAEGRGGWIHTVNLDHLRMMSRGRFLPPETPRADIVVADGAPLIWASRVQGTALPERVAGSNLIYSLTEAAARSGRRVYFLGGNEGTAQACADRLEELYPGLSTCGIKCPPLGFESDPRYMESLRAELASARPDLVFVALGAPKSEALIQEWRELVPSAWWIGVGISFSFVTGDVQRAPRWMQRTGLEWVHRLYQEPSRLARRYLVHGIPFGLSLMARSVAARLTGAGRRPAE